MVLHLCVASLPHVYILELGSAAWPLAMRINDATGTGPFSCGPYVRDWEQTLCLVTAKANNGFGLFVSAFRSFLPLSRSSSAASGGSLHGGASFTVEKAHFAA